MKNYVESNLILNCVCLYLHLRFGGACVRVNQIVIKYTETQKIGN